MNSLLFLFSVEMSDQILMCWLRFCCLKLNNSLSNPSLLVSIISTWPSFQFSRSFRTNSRWEISPSILS